MQKAEAMRQLEAQGTAQNRKVYARHGVRGDQFGVSFAALKKLQKQIGTNQGLAEELWDSGNHDARILATMVADPKALTARTLDAWVQEIDSYVLSDALSGLAARSPTARKRAEKWMRSRAELVAASGWNVVARLALEDEGLEDSSFEGHLATIESSIHQCANRTRYAMNGALIAIGARSAALAKTAIAAARRIGTVHVDHGETGCKTPDAVAYIGKTRARRAGKARAR